MRDAVYGQYLARKHEYLKHQGRDLATFAAETASSFTPEWADLDRRMRIVPGKDCLRQLNALLQDRYRLSLQSSRIVGEMRISEIPVDIKNLVESLETFRVKRHPTESNRSVPTDG